MFDTTDGDVDPGIQKLQINFPVSPYIMYMRKLHTASRCFCNLFTGNLLPMVFVLKQNRHRKSNEKKDGKY